MMNNLTRKVGTMTDNLKPGDTIKCSSFIEMIEVMNSLAKEGVETDFKTGKGERNTLVVKKVRENEC